MIKENFLGDRDEYFLIEYHNASLYDKSFENLDEYSTYGYNKGVLIWHVKEDSDILSVGGGDNLIQLETAIPYNGWNNNPIQNDDYPRNYSRLTNWNGIRSGDYNYLDDNLVDGDDKFIHLPDGGKHIWETTVINDNENTYGWDPTGQRRFFRFQSMRSDFFTDENIRGYVTNSMTDITRPSTKTWGGYYTSDQSGLPSPSEKTHIAITNITRQNGYMSLKVYYNYWTEDITTNTTLSGNVFIGKNITVSPGVTVTVQPGANLTFLNGASLTVNGTLTANGTPANKIIFNRNGTTGMWGSLKFDGAGASSSLLNNVEVYNSANIQILNDANIIVENSKIQDCTQGIYIYNASPQILNNQILHPLQHGIYVDASGRSPLILDNTITKIPGDANYKNQEGIILYNGTCGYIAHNDIKGFNHGIYVGGGSYVSFTDYDFQQSFPNNRFTDNLFGIKIAWGSWLDGGFDDMNLGGWNNSIYGNANYEIIVYQSSLAFAMYNYWGSDNFYCDGTSDLCIWPYTLPYDPWGSQSAMKLITTTDYVIPDVQPTNINANSAPKILDVHTSKELVPKVQATKLNKDVGVVKIDNDFFKGIKLKKEGKIDAAIEQLKKVVKDKKYGLYAITELAGIKVRYGKENIQTYFEDLLKDTNTEHKSRIKKALASFYLCKNEDDRAVVIYDELKNNKSSIRDNFDGLLDKFTYMLHKKKDIISATKLLTEMKNKFSADEEAMLHIVTAEMLISEDYNFSFGKKQNKSETSVDTEIPKEYALFNNYPNPFNPATTITYQLPKSGSVTLKIYDILGNEVKTLVNEQKEMGRYTVTFNASSFASGMYVYQLRANDYTSTKKMLLLK